MKFSKGAPRARHAVAVAARGTAMLFSAALCWSSMSIVSLAHADEPGDAFQQDPGSLTQQPDSGQTAALPEGRSIVQILTGNGSNWKEDTVASLPALPQKKNLLPFTVSASATLQFAVDSKSISIGKDGVVRYTVVVTSDEGARNIRYEGIRCANYSWRLYSGTNADGSTWDNASTNWMAIQANPMNGYQDELFNDFFCSDHAPVQNVKQIVESIKYGRTLRSVGSNGH